MDENTTPPDEEMSEEEYSVLNGTYTEITDKIVVVLARAQNRAAQLTPKIKRGERIAAVLKVITALAGAGVLTSLFGESSWILGLVTLVASLVDLALGNLMRLKVYVKARNASAALVRDQRSHEEMVMRAKGMGFGKNKAKALRFLYNESLAFYTRISQMDSSIEAAMEDADASRIDDLMLSS